MANSDQEYEEWVRDFSRPAMNEKQLDEIEQLANEKSDEQLRLLVQEVKLLRWLSESLLNVAENSGHQSNPNFLGLARFLVNARKRQE